MECNGCGRLLLIRRHGTLAAFMVLLSFCFIFSFSWSGCFCFLVFTWIGIGTVHMGRVSVATAFLFYSFFLVFMASSHDESLYIVETWMAMVGGNVTRVGNNIGWLLYDDL